MTTKQTTSIWNKNWLSSAVAATSIILCAFWFQSADTLTQGIQIFGSTLTNDAPKSILYALILASSIFFISELIRQKKAGISDVIEPHPEKNVNFYANCFVFYIQNIVLLIAIKMFYQTAGEYGFSHRAAFYQPWFLSLDLFINLHYYLGLPYIILTRSFKYNPEADNSRYGNLIGKIAFLLIYKLPFCKELKPEFGSNEKQIFLSLLLQLFFLPLIVVFFFQAFPELVNSIAYIKNGLPNSFIANEFRHATFNLDLARIAISFLFSAHLIILFASYAMTSRWINNGKQIVDPTLFSWLFCLVVYPPFHHLLLTSWVEAQLGPKLEAPSHLLSQIPNQSLVTVCIVLMILFYSLHVIATLTIGKNFANLSYRSLVQTGLYSIVRHPSYASKMLGLTCILLPLIGLNAYDENWLNSLSLIGGLAFGYILFTIRALREEILLKQHTDYSEYCKKVPYRFIPKII